MENSSVDGKSEELKNVKKTIKKPNILQKNKALIGLLIITLAVIAINEYDKKNSQTINTVVDPKLVTTLEDNKDSEQKIMIFVYNPAARVIEEKEVNLVHQASITEGDYVTQIIQNSNFSDKNLKFQSAYILDEDGKKVMKVMLNSEFMSVKGNQELFNGFSQAVSETLKRQYGSIEEIQIKIDGDKSD